MGVPVIFGASVYICMAKITFTKNLVAVPLWGVLGFFGRRAAECILQSLELENKSTHDAAACDSIERDETSLETSR